jgi:hypothetical protein
MMDTLELFLSEVWNFARNAETADVRFYQRLVPFESSQDIEPLLSNIRI